MIRIKICGNTSIDDALSAAKLGAHSLGFIFFQKSKRFISPQNASLICSQIPPFISKTGVFVNESAEVIHDIIRQCQLDTVQLHGEESPDFCRQFKVPVIKAFRIRNTESIQQMKNYSHVNAWLVDSYQEGSHGGTGQTFDWQDLDGLKKFQHPPLILSGGLTPNNVRQAIQQIAPYGVDVCSGVESVPGQKNPDQLRSFIHQVRHAIKL